MQLLLIDKKHQEVQPVLTQAGHFIETWTGAAYQREYLKVYFLVLQVGAGNLFLQIEGASKIYLQVCHYLMAGQVKGVKPCLKQLQQSIQAIMQTEDGTYSILRDVVFHY